MDELSLLLMNGNVDAIREYFRKEKEFAFEAGLLTGSESVKDRVAEAISYALKRMQKIKANLKLSVDGGGI